MTRTQVKHAGKTETKAKVKIGREKWTKINREDEAICNPKITNQVKVKVGQTDKTYHWTSITSRQVKKSVDSCPDEI